jgi:hypothetical protein
VVPGGPGRFSAFVGLSAAAAAAAAGEVVVRQGPPGIPRRALFTRYTGVRFLDPRVIPWSAVVEEGGGRAAGYLRVLLSARRAELAREVGVALPAKGVCAPSIRSPRGRELARMTRTV